MKNRKNYLRHREKLRRLVNEGWVFENSYVCDVCGSVLYDICMYDAKGCLSCDTWADDICSDPDCPVCLKRPATPRGVDFLSRNIVGHAVSRKISLQDNYFHKTNGALKHLRKYRKADDFGSDEI